MDSEETPQLTHHNCWDLANLHETTKFRTRRASAGSGCIGPRKRSVCAAPEFDGRVLYQSYTSNPFKVHTERLV